MNKVDVKNYIDPSWDVSDIVVEASQELVDKWLPMMNYSSDSWRNFHFTEQDITSHRDETKYYGNKYKLPSVDLKDRLEVSKNLEFLELVYKANYKECGFTYKVRWAVMNYRGDCTKRLHTDAEAYKLNVKETIDLINYNKNSINIISSDIEYKQRELLHTQDALKRFEEALIRLKEQEKDYE